MAQLRGRLGVAAELPDERRSDGGERAGGHLGHLDDVVVHEPQQRGRAAIVADRGDGGRGRDADVGDLVGEQLLQRVPGVVGAEPGEGLAGAAAHERGVVGQPVA